MHKHSYININGGHWRNQAERSWCWHWAIHHKVKWESKELIMHYSFHSFFSILCSTRLKLEWRWRSPLANEMLFPRLNSHIQTEWMSLKKAWWWCWWWTLSTGWRYGPLEVSIETMAHKYRPETRGWTHLDQQIYPYRQQQASSISFPSSLPFVHDTACNSYR